MIAKVGITSIFVTHDQEEAMEVADTIIITNLGRVEQIGSPEEICKRPQTDFVTDFIDVARFEAMKSIGCWIWTDISARIDISLLHNTLKER